MITYIATNTKNGKFYIGSTLNLGRRKEEHLKCHDFPFQRALKNDPEAFEWESWEDNSDEPVLEQALLDVWYGKEQCYNLSPFATRPPGNLGVPHTKQTKQKIGEKLRGKLVGDKNPSKRDEVREKISNAKKGVARDQKTREKIAEGVRGKKHWINANGERKLQVDHPGEGWQRGMKWRA
jgi:group I intron endonuclease